MTGTLWRWENVPIPEQHLVALGAASLAHLVLPARLPIGRRTSGLAGGAMLAVGLALAAWAVTSASRAGVAVDRPGALVTSGAFSVARNPMYQGWTMAVMGLGIATRSAWMLAGSVFAAAAANRAILAEEADLLRAFGDRYADYRARTPRYVTPGAVAPVRRMIRGGSVIDRRRS